MKLKSAMTGTAIAAAMLMFAALPALGGPKPEDPGTASRLVQATESDDDDEQETDYWKEIPFSDDDFAAVRRIVDFQYIDPKYNRKLAWVNAADYVLQTMDPPMVIMPRLFFLHEYKGRPFEKLSRGDKFVITAQPDAEEFDFKSMSEDEIRKKREALRKRASWRELEWQLVGFSEADFKRVVEFVKAREAGKPDFREDNLYIAATTGYLSSLDPHTTIVSAKAWDETTKDTEDGSFEGIGAILTSRGDDIIVETPVEGQPAEKAGIRAGDQIISVNGRKVGGMALHKVVGLIKGEKGTTVTLMVRRLGMPDDLEFKIVRQHIEVLNIQSHMIKGHPDVGYLKITGFVDGTARRVDDAIAGLVKETKGGRLRGLVLDLRANSGGLLQESVNIADAFLDKGTIVSVKSPNERDDKYEAKPGMWDFPMVVLVNSSSASASEILASAIQENGRGLVIGDRTFGKASVQTLVPAYPRTDYYVKVTIARYYAPSGRTIQVTGVSPDVNVPPQAGGAQPLGFREEDLQHHLTKINTDYKSPNVALQKRLASCTARMGTAEPKGRADLHPTIKADYQLATGVDYLECMWLDQEHNRKLSGLKAGDGETTAAAAP